MNESDFDFWISVEDLVEFFDNVYIAHQSSDTMAGTHSVDKTQKGCEYFEKLLVSVFSRLTKILNKNSSC